MINSLPFHKLSCTCGLKGNLIKHGYYKRSVKSDGELIQLKILRLICKSCKKTHSILPNSIVPYSRTLLKDQINIISTYLLNGSFDQVMIDNILIDESNLRYIINNFNRHWKERLISFKIHLNNELIKLCFKYYNRQFMQIKCTPNILFVAPT